MNHDKNEKDMYVCQWQKRDLLMEKKNEMTKLFLKFDNFLSKFLQRLVA